MNCTIKEHYLWGKEIVFSEVPGGEVVSLPEDTVRLLQECEIEKVQNILNEILGNTDSQ